MKKIWLILIFLVNLTPNIVEGTFTLTSMNRIFAQLGINEFICEDEYGVFDSSIPCDELPCIAVCEDCGEQNICVDEHICQEEECETCGDYYIVGGYHDCGSPICCSICYQNYYPMKGHSCQGDNDEDDNEEDPPTPPNPENPPVTPDLTPLEQAKNILKNFITKVELNDTDIIKLGHLFNNLSSQKGYNILLDFIKTYPVSRFLINPNVTLGGYNPKDKSIGFKSSETIDIALKEELIHHVQNILYKNGISQYNKTDGGLSQIEFETKVLQDILCVINGGGCAWYGCPYEATADYTIWIYNICSDEEIPNNEKLFKISPDINKNYNSFLYLT